MDKTLFTYICCKNCNVWLKRRKWTKKRPRMVHLKDNWELFESELDEHSGKRLRIFWSFSLQKEMDYLFSKHLSIVLRVSFQCRKLIYRSFPIWTSFTVFSSKMWRFLRGPKAEACERDADPQQRASRQRRLVSPAVGDADHPSRHHNASALAVTRGRSCSTEIIRTGADRIQSRGGFQKNREVF